MYVIVILFNSQAGVFKGFSIISALFGGVVAGTYSFMIVVQKSFIWDERYMYGKPKDRNYDVEVAILAMILILSFIEIVIGIWAAVSIHKMRICCLYSPPPRVSRIYMYLVSHLNTTYYIFHMGAALAVSSVCWVIKLVTWYLITIIINLQLCGLWSHGN